MVYAFWTASTSTTEFTTTYLVWPEGPRVYRKVKQFVDATGKQTGEAPEGHGHKWHEMLHNGRRGTGYATCRCGAVGIIYGRDQRREPKGIRP